MGRQTDGQTDKSDFIGRCSTNVERPKTQNYDTNNILFLDCSRNHIGWCTYFFTQLTNLLMF